MFCNGKEGFTPIFSPMARKVLRQSSCHRYLVHVDSGLIDDWLGGSSVRSTKDLGLGRYSVKLSVMQPLTMTDSLLAVKDVSTSVYEDTANNLGNNQP